MAGPTGLSRDWLTIWQSELSASAADRERGETVSTLVGQGAELARLLLALADGPAGSAPPPPPTWAATADAAPDARDAAIEHLGRRVAELEQRLARREPGSA